MLALLILYILFGEITEMYFDAKIMRNIRDAKTGIGTKNESFLIGWGKLGEIYKYVDIKQRIHIALSIVVVCIAVGMLFFKS
jgi:hypothetical protein